MFPHASTPSLEHGKHGGCPAALGDASPWNTACTIIRCQRRFFEPTSRHYSMRKQKLLNVYLKLDSLLYKYLVMVIICFFVVGKVLLETWPERLHCITLTFFGLDALFCQITQGSALRIISFNMPIVWARSPWEGILVDGLPLHQPHQWTKAHWQHEFIWINMELKY